MQTTQSFRLSILLALPVLAFFNMGAEGGCANAEDSEDVAADRLYAQHWLYYNAKSDKTDVRAAFRFGNELGTIVQLNPPAKVSFGTTPLGFDPNWGWHHTEVAGVADNGTIVYVDKEGKESRVPTGTLGRIAFANTPIALDRTASATLAWQGAALEQGENVELFVSSTSNAANFVTFGTSAAGATSVVLTPDLLSRLPPGPIALAFKRHKVTRPDAKTKVSLSYESLNASGDLR